MEEQPNRRAATALHVALAIAMQAVVWLLLVVAFYWHHPWYGFFDVSDITVYKGFAQAFARGQLPYQTVSFEYPPLAVPLMAFPAKLRGMDGYDWAFAWEMMLASAAAAAVATATAVRLAPGRRGPLLTSGAFALLVLCAGPLVANRFDAVVALDMAIVAYCLARRWWWGAAAALGMGFSLKLTPAMFLPLVLLLATEWRARFVAGLAFIVAALGPFLPQLLRGGRGLANIFTYHAHRPLQIESLMASPYLVGHALGGVEVMVRNSYGSQGLVGTGTKFLAALSPWLIALCLLALYGLLWRRRHHLRDHLADVPLAALGLVLVLVCTSKVLSPQFLVWTFPLVSLVAGGRGWRRLAMGIGVVCATLLTQFGFPSRYWALVDLDPNPIGMLVSRNLTLLLLTVFTILQVRRSGRGDEDRAIPAGGAPGSGEAAVTDG